MDVQAINKQINSNKRTTTDDNDTNRIVGNENTIFKDSYNKLSINNEIIEGMPIVEITIKDNTYKKAVKLIKDLWTTNNEMSNLGNQEITILDNNQVSNNNNDENVKLKDLKVMEPNIDRHRRKLRSRTNTLYLLLRITVEYKVLLKQWLLCALICSVSGYREQKFAMEPQDQSAVVGSRVILPCRVEGKSGQLQWTKDDFGLGTHRHLNGYERYRMIGSDEEGDYSLDIREVTLDDDALYQCQVSSGPHGEVPIRSRYARLIVLMPPDPPKIMQGVILNAIEDREVNLECLSIGGRPAAEITWVDNDGGVLTQGVNYTMEPMPDGRRFTARYGYHQVYNKISGFYYDELKYFALANIYHQSDLSTLLLRPRRHHHNQTFTCQAQNTADRAYRAVTIKLQVLYAPKVRMFVKTGLLKYRIQEGDTVVIGCQANANPNNLTYKWFVNNKQLLGDIRNELVLSNVSRKFNEATVKCEVYNDVGRSADTKTLEVAYGPSFYLKPENVEADKGSTATLTCVVDGHPSPMTTWLRYENERFIIVGKSSDLTITVNPHSAGQYWCRGSIDGRANVETPAMIYIRGPPKIMSNQTQYGVEGDSVRIECVSFSVPKPDYVMWTFGGSEINSFHNQEYAFLEETLSDRMTKSTLIVRRSDAKHFGPYNCTVMNSFGMDSVEITLLPDKSLPLVLIVAALVSIIIIILIIMLIIMLCHRKTSKDVKKPDLTNLEKTCVDYKDSDRHSNISDLKLELRQVEGSCDINNSNGGSETDLHPTLHLTSNLGLPLAGPVPLPDSGYDNELMKQYQRYSGDFNQAINHLNFKGQAQTNGYVPYVDYSRDYTPPSVPSDSLSGSLSRSINESYPNQGSLRRLASCGRLGGLIGPDVIPMANPGVVITGGVDVRYAATYGNPYLRGSGSLSYAPHNTNPQGKHAPPPYYTIRNTNHTSSGPSISPASSSSSRPVTSPLASSSSTSGAQPQVPKASPQSSGALYILPPSSQGSLQSQKILKGSGSQLTPGTHV